MAFPITAALPIVGNLLGGAMDRAQSQRNAMFQQGLSDVEFARNVRFWQMQNEYNSPKAQMQRFAEAGLNPHLIYGQGTPGNAQGLVRYQKPEVQAPLVINPGVGPAVTNTLSTLMEVGLWSQEMRKKELEIDLLSRTVPTRADLVGYQRDVARENVFKSQADVATRLAEFEHLYGAKLSGISDFDYREGAGMRSLQRRKLDADARLRELQGEYYEPALLFKAVLGGALGLAGLLRGAGRSGMSFFRKGRKPPSKITETESIKRVGRTRSTRVERYID